MRNMGAVKLYSGISTIYSSILLLALFLSDVSNIGSKATFPPVISYFVCMELLKFFVLTSKVGVDKFLHANISSHSHSNQKTSSEKKFKLILKGITVMLLTTSLYHLCLILFGARVFENFEETLMLSALLSVLTVLPLCLYYGPNQAVGALLNGSPSHSSNFETMLRQSLYLTIFGAWISAVVIPLDWDRPWQKWPVPCTLGAIVGYWSSHIVALLKHAFCVSKIGIV